MKKTKNEPAIEKIEAMAMRGEDVGQFFKNQRVRKPADSVQRRNQRIKRVNIDFGEETLSDLDNYASKLNISRQAAIKVMIRSMLDQHFMAEKAKHELVT